MQVTFYGVRGSIPTPGAQYTKYGGNTACVHVLADDGTQIVLDAGTGIRLLGLAASRANSHFHILLSHNHWDHIQGFPFFAPIFEPSAKIDIYPALTRPNEPDAILSQMDGSRFPVPVHMLKADIQIHSEIKPVRNINQIQITSQAINHPGGGAAYRLQSDNKVLVYMTDNELYPPYKKQSDFLSFVEFAQDADLLIHDAQYTLADMPTKSGWGHSVAEEAVKLAMAAKVKKLALYSHDPARSDDDIDALIDDCNSLIEIAGVPLLCFGAKENQRIIL